MQYYGIIFNRTNISNGKYDNVEKFSKIKIKLLIISILNFLIVDKVFQTGNCNLNIVGRNVNYFSSFIHMSSPILLGKLQFILKNKKQ